MDNNFDLTIETLAPLIEKRKISPVELTRFLLSRISRLQPVYNAYITVTVESALAAARRAERDIVRGHYRGALHGIPISLKDLFHTRGIATTAGSRILSGFIPGRSASVVDRLHKAGCILLGKTNMHEFAFGPTNINPHYGPVRNPWDPRCIAGGSSGGSAASVVCAMAIASLGTDTGGSIRIPAAACGCVGLKPTRGSIPMDGVIPLSFTLDHVGPITRSVTDAAIMYQAISEPHPEKLSVVHWRKILRKGGRPLRVGLPEDYFFDHLDAEVHKAVEGAIEVFRKLGAAVTEVKCAGLEETSRLAAEIAGDEAAAYHEKWLKDAPSAYGRDVRMLLQASRKSTATTYIRALEAMRAYAQRMVQALESVDVLLAPTIPIAAPDLEQPDVRIGRYREDIRQCLLRLTRPGNLSGLPALSLPCGFAFNRLPIGLQLLAKHSEERTLLRAARAYEAASPWHERFPADSETDSVAP